MQENSLKTNPNTMYETINVLLKKIQKKPKPTVD